MHGIHPCKDGTLRGNLVFQKLDVVATILQIQCPSAGAAALSAGVLSLRLPLQSIAKSSFYITLHRLPRQRHATPRKIFTAFALFQIHGDRYSPQSYRSTEAGSTQKAALFYTPTAWLTSGQGRHSAWIELLNSHRAGHPAHKTLRCINEGRCLSTTAASGPPAFVVVYRYAQGADSRSFCRYSEGKP